MIERASASTTHSGNCGVLRVIVFSAVFIVLQPHLQGQTFKSTTYQGKSQTAGIQEAIDAAAKGGGGTVQIPAGSFVLHASPDRPAIVLRSGVSVIGAGADKTILKLEPNSKASPAVMANQGYANPDLAEPDHDITLEGFTIDVAASDQVKSETKLSGNVPLAGERELALESKEGVGIDSLVRVEPGPNEEIIPVLPGPSGKLRMVLIRPHAPGAKVIILRDRLHAVALVGAQSVTLRDMTFQNVNMDAIYLTSTMDATPHHTYCKKINVLHSNFIACHRNGVSVIDAEDVTVADNNFRDITGDPGAPVDIEPNRADQHGTRIAIRNNQAFKCYRGITIALRLGVPNFNNFRDETVSGNNLSGMLYGWGIYIGQQQAGAVVTGNTIAGPAADGIILIGSSGVQVTNNEIIDPGRCHFQNCRGGANGVGIRIADDNAHGMQLIADRNTVMGNNILDDQSSHSLLYGIEFSTSGKENIIQKNVVSRFDRRGMVVHVSGNARSNTISENVQK